MLKCNIIQSKYETRWPRFLRHELLSPARAVWSWVLIPLHAWIYVCGVHSVCVVLCVGSILAAG
jgi:hypothetical protein